MREFDAAVFDLDGTLLDSMWFWSELDGIFLKSRGIDTIPEDYLLAIAHLGGYETAVYTKERFSLPESPEEMMLEWREMSLDFYRNRVGLKPGAYEYLEALKKAGIKLAVATANEEELFRPAIKLTGIDIFFDAFADVSEVERKKGFPDIYLLAAERLGAKPENTVVFEDIYVALCGAADGGFRTVGVLDDTSLRDRELIMQKADRYIKDFNELLPFEEKRLFS